MKTRKKPKRQPSPSRFNAFRLHKIISRALEPDVRSQIVAEVQRHVETGDPLFLASWLRNVHMKWLPNVPVCACGSVMNTAVYRLDEKSIERYEPDAKSWTGYTDLPGPDPLCSRIERSSCPKCHAVREQSRSNDVMEILVSRIGRCGEFAIAYTSILIALGYQARLMFTLLNDHLWAEVRVKSEWVPVDVAAEDTQRLIRDRFMFEKWGWKLKDLYAIEPGTLPHLNRTYRTPKKVKHERRKAY